MIDRLLCASQKYLEMYVFSILSHKGIPPKDIDINKIIDQIRLTGRADLVLANYGQRVNI